MERKQMAQSTAAVLTMPELAQLMGVSPWLVYERAKRNDLPVPVLRVGRRMLVSRTAVERLLAAEKTAAS